MILVHWAPQIRLKLFSRRADLRKPSIISKVISFSIPFFILMPANWYTHMALLLWAFSTSSSSSSAMSRLFRLPVSPIAVTYMLRPTPVSIHFIRSMLQRRTPVPSRVTAWCWFSRCFCLELEIIYRLLISLVLFDYCCRSMLSPLRVGFLPVAESCHYFWRHFSFEE